MRDAMRDAMRNLMTDVVRDSVAKRLLPVLVVFMLVAAACGGQDDDPVDAIDDDVTALDAGDDESDGTESDGAASDAERDAAQADVDGAADDGDSADAADGDSDDGDSGAADSEDGDAGDDEGADGGDDASDESSGGDGDGADGDDSGSDDRDGSSDTAGDDTTDTSEGSDTSETPDTEAPDTADSAPSGGVVSVDWWGCWQARDAVTSDGVVTRLPNCATGPSSVGEAGDMFGSANAPVYRASGAGGNPSIEFTHAGDTLIQTNGGQPWTGGDILPSDQGVTMAWIGMMTDVNSHEGKFLVSGQSRDNRFPFVRVRGRGENRFEAYGGGSVEALSGNGSVVDNRIQGVLIYLAPDRSASVIELDGTETLGGQDSQLRRNIFGLTLGNSYDRNFSTTDHQFLFLGMKQGQMSSEEKAAFWAHLESLR